MATKRRREDAADDGGVANTPAGAASKASTTTVVSADSERATTTTGGAGGAKAKAKKAKGGYLGSIVAALRQLKTPGGSSQPAIAKALRADGLDNKNAVKKALATGIKNGTLAKAGARFKVVGDPEYEAPDDGFRSEDVSTGSGAEAKKGMLATVSYVGTLASDGSEFDRASSFSFRVHEDDVIKGWHRGVEGMRVGGTRKLTVPPELGYGKRGSPPEIPGGATLLFTITLKDVHA